MGAITFDSLAFVKTVEEAGADRRLAEGMAAAMSHLNVNTKAFAEREEIVEVRHDIRIIHKDIAGIKTHIATQLATKTDLHQLELRMTLRLGGLMVTLSGLLAGIHYFG